MTTRHLSLGSRSLRELHESAILLWIDAKKRDSQSNPAHGVFFALTMETWPVGVAEVSNAIDLCDVLSEAMGQPRLTEEQRRALNATAVILLAQYESGLSLFHVSRFLKWPTRIAYLLGASAQLHSGFSWWVAGLMVATWLCFGAAKTAARMSKEELRPAWELPLIGWMHIAALIALVVAAFLHIYQ